MERLGDAFGTSEENSYPCCFFPRRVLGRLEGASRPLAGQLMRMGWVGAEILALALLGLAGLKLQLQLVGAKVGFVSLFL